jgi:hypothetical protein
MQPVVEFRRIAFISSGTTELLELLVLGDSAHKLDQDEMLKKSIVG